MLKKVIHCYDVATCFREQMQFALNKQLEHFKLQQSAQSLSRHPGWMSSAFKTKSDFVRIKQILMLLLTMSECAVPDDVHT